MHEKGRIVTFGNNNEGIVIGKGAIGKCDTEVENVILVWGFKYNLLSTSQLSDKCYHVKFEKNMCQICCIRK